MVSHRNGACLRLADGQEFGAYLPVFFRFTVCCERESKWLPAVFPSPGKNGGSGQD